MLAFVRRGTGCLAVAHIQHRQLDVDKITNPRVRDPNNPIDRVMKIFDRDDFGTISAEASWVLVTSCIAVAIGGLQGGIRYINIATTKHLRGNEATVYESGIEARRKLLDKSHLSFMRGFLAHGIRTGFFMFSLTGVTTLLACYRNKPAVVDYTVGGALAGSLYKFSLGPKGMVSGGVFGGILGTFAGALIVPMIKLSDKQMSEFYATTHEYFKYKDRNLHASPLVQGADDDRMLHIKKKSSECPAGNGLDEIEDLDENTVLKYNKSLKISSK